jgi:transcriptional regulator with XRE-family HTH domain
MSPTATDTLRAQVRTALRAAGISQHAAADRLGLSEKHLSQMLTGKVRLSLEWAEQLLGLCGQSLTIRPGAPSAGPTGASSPDPLPLQPVTHGPALLFVSGDGQITHTTEVDRVAVGDPRERALCRALLTHATALLDKAERDGARHPVGFQAPKEP